MSSSQNTPRVLALYLPQFHPTPENDEWYGKGFTEWTNVGKAKPLFRGHYQPIVPADLGYYDLRLPEIRQAQADMAAQYGIEGFCYWHYWFGNGRKMLDMPFREVLQSGKPDFPFCLGWANHSWHGIYNGVKTKEPLLEQKYFGLEDYKQHFYDVLPAFQDKRYIRVNNKPFFLIYNPSGLPSSKEFIEYWQDLAHQNGLDGIHFVAHTYLENEIDKWLGEGYDAVNIVRLFDYQRSAISLYQKVINKLNRDIFKRGFWCEYKEAMKYFSGEKDKKKEVYPTLIPNWDHSPRTEKNGSILKNSTPQLFKKHVIEVKKSVMHKPEQEQIILLKSWNEWGEGNYMEPDLKYGLQYLEALKDGLNSK